MNQQTIITVAIVAVAGFLALKLLGKVIRIIAVALLVGVIAAAVLALAVPASGKYDGVTYNQVQPAIAQINDFGRSILSHLPSSVTLQMPSISAQP